MKLEKAPQESYADVGGLDTQIQEIKESVELPLTHPELYEEMGIKPPKGVILYGAPGTGKTLLAKVGLLYFLSSYLYPLIVRCFLFLFLLLVSFLLWFLSFIGCFPALVAFLYFLSRRNKFRWTIILPG